MKSNKLILVNGIVSIIAGILIMYFSLQSSSFEFVDLIVSFIENYIWALLIMLINVFLLILSLAGMSHYSGDSRVNKMNHQMLLFASIMGFIPFLAIFAGLLSIGAGFSIFKIFKNLRVMAKLTDPCFLLLETP